MGWIYLFFAGLCEVVWALGLKHTDGFTKLWPSVLTITFMIISFQLLSMALRTLPVGTAYAVWTGIGAAGVAIIGVAFFGESADVGRLASLAMIVAGVVGLKFFSGH